MMRARKETVEISIAGVDLEVSGEYTPRERGSAPTLEHPGDPDIASEFSIETVLIGAGWEIGDGPTDITELLNLAVGGNILDTIANAATDVLDQDEDDRRSDVEDYDHE